MLVRHPGRIHDKKDIYRIEIMINIGPIANHPAETQVGFDQGRHLPHGARAVNLVNCQHIQRLMCDRERS